MTDPALAALAHVEVALDRVDEAGLASAHTPALDAAVLARAIAAAHTAPVTAAGAAAKLRHAARTADGCANCEAAARELYAHAKRCEGGGLSPLDAAGLERLGEALRAADAPPEAIAHVQSVWVWLVAACDTIAAQA